MSANANLSVIFTWLHPDLESSPYTVVFYHLAVRWDGFFLWLCTSADIFFAVVSIQANTDSPPDIYWVETHTRFTCVA